MRKDTSCTPRPSGTSNTKGRGMHSGDLEFAKRAKSIEDEFFATPLTQVAPQSTRGLAEMAKALHRLEDLAKQQYAQKDQLR